MKNLFIVISLVILFHAKAFNQDFYDINTINTIEITFEESNWDYILDQLYAAGDEERLVGSVAINGITYDSVGVRYKGNSTYQPNQLKNPLNIKLDHIIDDQTIDGYGTLKLANVYKDPSFVREVLGYEIARKYFPASQSNYANVYINGTHMGLYTNDQSVDKFFTQNAFGSDENTRAKGEITTNGPPTGGVWQYFGQDSSDYYSYYDMKSDYGWQELINFLDTLNNHNDYVDQVLNIDRHLWFLAFSNLLVNLDGPINNPQNYYLYKDDNGRFNPVPWDLNESFGVFASHQTLGNLNINGLQTLSPFANINESNFPVISKILSNDTYRKIYVAHMKTIIDENFTDNQYLDRALEIQDIIASDVQADQNKFYTYSNFTDNLYNTVGGGPMGGVIGISQLMDTRVSYIENLTDFQYTQPQISDVNHSPEQPQAGNEIIFLAEVSDGDNVMLAYRTSTYGIFEKTEMFDDGQHHDASANDGLYGVSLQAGSTDIEYYIYAENENAAAFSPVRAEYEFYEIKISGALVINEFMADNESTVTDQDGNYDDWIEFYNKSDEAINLNGYFLSDDAAEPDQWTFPDTSIAAGGYLIVWADKDEDQQGLHASFKLSADGEQIILSDANLTTIDEISFGLQKADTSMGRFPNGNGDFIEMLPTFEAVNVNYLTVIDDTDAESVSTSLNSNYPNPFRQQTTISFSLAEADEITLSIYNQNGMLIETILSGQMPAGEHLLDWEAGYRPKGLYICILHTSKESLMNKMIIQ